MNCEGASKTVNPPPIFIGINSSRNPSPFDLIGLPPEFTRAGLGVGVTNWEWLEFYLTSYRRGWAYGQKIIGDL